MISRDHSERRILEDFTRNRENTMNSVVSSSVGKALLHLGNKYLGVSPTEEAVEKFIENGFLELRKLSTDDLYIEFKLAIEDMMRVASEPPSTLDQVTIFHLLENGEIDSQTYVIPLKQVLPLVWKAINDNAAYMQNYEGTPAQQLAQACEDQEMRVASFLKCLKGLRANPVCHHGQRNELVFLLNKTYLDVDILEDGKTPVLMILKEELSKRLVVALESCEGTLESTIASGMIGWMENNNACDLIKLLDPKSEIRAKLFSLFISHGVSPDDVKLNDTIDGALCYLEFPRDHQTNPVLASAAELLGEIEDHTQPERSRMLKSMQDSLRAGDVSGWQDSIADFYRVYSAHKSLQVHKIILLVSGEMAEDVYHDYISYFVDTFKLESFLFSDEIRNKVDECHEKIRRCKRNSLQDVIENFFAKWFSTTPRRLRSGQLVFDQVRCQLYEVLLDERVTSAIILNDSDIELLQREANPENELAITPYMINRIFLHAILISPVNWTEKFSMIFKAVLEFVENGLGQIDLHSVGGALYRDSYNVILLHQLRYLLKVSEAEGIVGVYRPPQMILTPMHARTASEWESIFRLLPAKRAEALLRSNMLLIMKSVIRIEDFITVCGALSSSECQQALIRALGVNLKNSSMSWYHLARCLSRLHAASQLVLLETFGDRLGMMGDPNHFDMCLIYLDKANRFTFLSMLENQYSRVFVDGNQLATCLSGLDKLTDSVQFKQLLLNAIGNELGNIIKNGFQLAKCLLLLDETNRFIFISKVEGQLCHMIVDGEELACFLSLLDVSTDSVQLKQLLLNEIGGELGIIIKDGYQLASCLSKLDSLNQANLLAAIGDQWFSRHPKIGAQLGDYLAKLKGDEKTSFYNVVDGRFKDIVKNGIQLGYCLSKLTEDVQLNLLNAFDGGLKEVIQNSAQLGFCLTMLTKENQLGFLKALGDNLDELIQTREEFHDHLLSPLADCRPTKLVKEYSHRHSFYVLTLADKEAEIEQALQALVGRLRNKFAMNFRL